MNTSNIERFLKTAYSDEKLAALLAHAQDGKLAFYSCCCLAGAATADHPLRGFDREHQYEKVAHYISALKLPFAKSAETEFCGLAPGWKSSSDEEKDAERRKAIIPLILAEMERRDPKVIVEEESRHVER